MIERLVIFLMLLLLAVVMLVPGCCHPTQKCYPRDGLPPVCSEVCE